MTFVGQSHHKNNSSSSDTTVRRSHVYQEDLKSYWKSEKRPYLLTIKRRLMGWYFLAANLFPTFLKEFSWQFHFIRYQNCNIFDKNINRKAIILINKTNNYTAKKDEYEANSEVFPTKLQN